MIAETIRKNCCCGSVERMFEAFGFSIITLSMHETVACGTGYSTAVNRDVYLVSIVLLDRPHALHHLF